MQQRAPAARPHPSNAGYREHGEYGEHGERGERGYGYRRKSWLAEIFD